MEIVFARQEPAVRDCECKSKTFQVERVNAFKYPMHIYTCTSCGRTQYRYPDGTEHQPELHPGTETTGNYDPDNYTRNRNDLKNMVGFMFPLYYYPNNVLARNGAYMWFETYPKHIDVAVYFWVKKKRADNPEKPQARIHCVEIRNLHRSMEENNVDFMRIKRRVLDVCNNRFPEYRFYQTVPEFERWGHMQNIYRDFQIDPVYPSNRRK